MEYKFEIMTQKQAEEIAFKWHYDSEYSFYDMQAEKEHLHLLEGKTDKYKIPTKCNATERNRQVCSWYVR